MARVYLVTDEEMQSLIESLELEMMRKQNLGPRESTQALTDMHRSFHYVVVRWAQAMGFKGYRG